MAELKTPVYIGVPDQGEIRRDLLLCSKDILFALKAYEAARDARARRVELTFDLHKVMDEIGVLTKKVRLKLPKMPGKITLGDMPQPREAEEKSASRGKSKKAGKDKLSVLDQEMTRVEARLKRLA